ncbi:NAD(P)-dependent oxidoreductase [Ovoidimarina sediminis]|uniref:NAD(P)-dependent oxidoreductase n=1 Tax=Ovoidimarina sediminis TaxID=3079856 RepID=UPI00290CC55A|nr:NAD(P)-binding domain-containing protein [Rhodophyticola sp. MJ-SS7]MDU8945622.1 NAD(P)-binding domain-containing protein [Rhodophyticola sp. MJ-SS7]
MSDITVVGLGAMGSAIARRFLVHGVNVTVWNRNPARADPLRAEGAKTYTDLGTALCASEKIVICVLDYDASKEVCDAPGIADALKGRSVIQLTGGTPADAADAFERMQAASVDYLDGAIMCYPGDLGGAGSQVLVSGHAALFKKWKSLLACLAEDLRFVGDNIRAAKTLDMALLSRFVGLKFSAMHGARICESEGVSLSEFAKLLPEGDNARRMVETIASDDFTLRPGSASVNVAMAVWAAMQSQARSTGINSELPDLFLRWCKDGAEQGWGELDNACLIRVLRESR